MNRKCGGNKTGSRTSRPSKGHFTKWLSLRRPGSPKKRREYMIMGPDVEPEVEPEMNIPLMIRLEIES